jgi:hypothetical protein
VTGAEQRTRGIVRALHERLDDTQRAQVGAWARRLLEIRAGRDLPPLKAWRTLDATSDAVASVLMDAGRGLVDLAAADRDWATRLGMAAGGATVTVMAAGSALAVPLWVVFGGGAPAARLLAEEMAPVGTSPGDDEHRPAEDDGLTVDGEWEWDAPRLAAANPRRPASPGEPLWHVFRRAYRDARTRHDGTAR